MNILLTWPKQKPQGPQWKSEFAKILVNFNVLLLILNTMLVIITSPVGRPCKSATQLSSPR